MVKLGGLAFRPLKVELRIDLVAKALCVCDYLQAIVLEFCSANGSVGVEVEV